MANIRFLYSNLWAATASVASASSAVSALPAANSQTTDRTAIWRSNTGTGTQQLQIDLGSAQSVTAVAIANVKLLSGGTVTLEQAGSGGSPGAWSAVGSALPASDADTKVTFAFFNSVSARHWRLNFSNPGAVSDYAEAGYVFLGTFTEPVNNVHVPFDAPIFDTSAIVKSLSGQRSTTIRPQQSRGHFGWEFMTDADRTTVQMIFRTLGFGTPFFCVLDTSLSWTAWLLYFNSELRRGFTLSNSRYDVGFDWEEAV